ncbi:MAG: prepilin-type N-terminal cleavage/methylation domain-containing protein [Candidatus Omnitrophota bacterium]
MTKFTNKNSGFTLIEIIVVLIILGVLAAIALPNLFSNVKRSGGGEAIGTLSTFKSVVEGCLQGHLPTSTESACAVQIPTSLNFTYSLTTPSTVAGAASFSNGSPNWTIVATNGTGNTISLTRTGGQTTSPATSCSGAGSYSGIC